MSTLALELPASRESAPSAPVSGALDLDAFGALTAVGRPGGQGRVYRPERVPPSLATTTVVVKLYRRPVTAAAAGVLAEMVAWGQALDQASQTRLHDVAAWPLAVVRNGATPIGIAMRDLSDWFEVPFVMPSGRRERVLLSLEHLLGSDEYLQLRGLGVRLDTALRAGVAERISGALAHLHRHGIVAGDIAPNNLLVGFGGQGPFVSLIDCDSMVFHGRQALPPVETTDWQLPPGFAEPRGTRAADAYKLGLVVLRLFTRSHDARLHAPQIGCVPVELRGLLSRSLSADAASRPPAGEWQRALREVVALGGLNARYPAPAARARVSPQPRQSGPETARWPPPAAPRRVPARPRPASAQPWSRTRRPSAQAPLAVAWFVVTVVVLFFILMRLVAAAEPSVNSGGFGPQGGGQAGVPFHYYYYVPASPAFGGGAFQ